MAQEMNSKNKIFMIFRGPYKNPRTTVFRYSGQSNKRTLCVYLFLRKILPCAALFHSSEQYCDSHLRLFIFGKIPCPVRLFHTVRLDSPVFWTNIYFLLCSMEIHIFGYTKILGTIFIQFFSVSVPKSQLTSLDYKQNLSLIFLENVIEC